jgi:hypothetical protein
MEKMSFRRHRCFVAAIWLLNRHAASNVPGTMPAFGTFKIAAASPKDGLYA